MIVGEIFISTTWIASTSFIPFNQGMRDAHDVKLGGTNNRGYFATTAYVHGVWEYQKFEEDFKSSLQNSDLYAQKRFSGGVDELTGLGGSSKHITNAFSPGTVIETSVRKIKALKASPNRSGIQVTRQLVNGNKLVFRYLAQGELVRP